MPFTTNNSIRVPHADKYVPKHITHDTTRYITIEGGDDARHDDDGKVDYMDISDITETPTGTSEAVTADDSDTDVITPDDTEKTPGDATEGVSGATDASTGAEQSEVHDDTDAKSDAGNGGQVTPVNDHAAERIADLSERLAKALDAEHDAEVKRDQAFKDLSNYKRRMDDERERARREAVADVGKSIMPAIDDLERVIDHYAMQSGDDTLAAVAAGCDGIRRKLLGSLSALGIEQIDPTGKEFDPDTSMAIAHEPRDGYVPNTVYMTYQKGYRIGDKVIRTATVGVAK